jgi:hypothetical protein
MGIIEKIGSMEYRYKMFYFRHKKFMYINEVNPLKDKLRPLVFTGDESDKQPFVYHYKCRARRECGQP